MQKEQVRARQIDADTVIPLKLYRHNIPVMPRDRTLPICQPQQRLFHIFGGQKPAVMKTHSLAQIEYIAGMLRIGLPHMGQSRQKAVVLGIIDDERAADLFDQVGFKGCIH
ncbi:hypothetical protein D3C73_1290630 [compost metagenome]